MAVSSTPTLASDDTLGKSQSTAITSQQGQTQAPDMFQHNTLQQYLGDPQNSAGFIEDFDYDSVDYTNIDYDPSMCSVDPMVVFADGLQEAFTSVDAANMGALAQPYGEKLVEMISAQDEQPMFDFFAGTYPLTGFPHRDLATQAPQARPQPIFEEPCIPRIPTAGTALDEPASTKPIAGLQFADRAQAQQAFVQRQVPYDWQAPQRDNTLPQNEADREKYIAQLMAAFVDVSQCQDSDTVESYRAHWAGIAEGRSPFTPQQMETVCWKLLEIAQTLHYHGPGSLRIFDDTKLQTTRKSRNLTFAQRIQFICDLMRLSKSRCEKLLGFDDMAMTVAAPAQMISRAKSNKKRNRKRQEYLIEGRAQLKRSGKGAVGKVHDNKDKDMLDQDNEAHCVPQPAPAVQAAAYFHAAALQANAQYLSNDVGVDGEQGNYGYDYGTQSDHDQSAPLEAHDNATYQHTNFTGTNQPAPADTLKRAFAESTEDEMLPYPNKR